MDAADTVIHAVRPRDFMCILDLKNTYLQIPIHLSSRKYLRFIYKYKIYQFKVLCFYHVTAPQVFTKVFALVSAWAYRNGIRLLRYLDNWLVLADLEVTLLHHRDMLLEFCLDLGILINLEKSSLLLSQTGIPRYDHKHRPTDSLTIRRKSTQAERSGITLPQIGGSTSSSMVTSAKSLDLSSPSSSKQPPQDQIPAGAAEASLEPTLRSARHNSSNHSGTDNGSTLVDSRRKPLQRPGSSRPSFGLDALCRRIKRRMLQHTISGLWSKSERYQHINLLEMRATYLALRQFHRLLAGHTVVLMSDNTAVVACINIQGSTFLQPLSHLVVEIPGRRNVLADNLSRVTQIVGSEWSLNPLIAKKFLTLWGYPTVDLSAVLLSIPDPQALWQDGFQQWCTLFPRSV
ncbi:uncharacterized protein [Palaemon carinicauda]|uniref:uncharacterized protein n=1 Tax=Palaemon carinicauda TaxID=392227 RepID=UPI0035B6A2DA